MRDLRDDQPEQARFTLLYQGRRCRLFRTLTMPGWVQIQFEDGHTAIVSRADVKAPLGDEFRGPDV